MHIGRVLIAREKILLLIGQAGEITVKSHYLKTNVIRTMLKVDQSSRDIQFVLNRSESMLQAIWTDGLN